MSTNTKSTHGSGYFSQPLSQQKQSLLPVVLSEPPRLVKAKARAGRPTRLMLLLHLFSYVSAGAEGVSYSATSSGSNQVQRQMLLTILPSLCFLTLELMVLIFALLSMCCQTLTTGVKIKIQFSEEGQEKGICQHSEWQKWQCCSLMFLAVWCGRVREHIITGNK